MFIRKFHPLKIHLNQTQLVPAILGVFASRSDTRLYSKYSSSNGGKSTNSRNRFNEHGDRRNQPQMFTSELKQKNNYNNKIDSSRKKNKLKTESQRTPIEYVTKVNHCGERVKVPVHRTSERAAEDISDEESDDDDLNELKAPNWDEIKLPKINKNIYQPSVLTESRSNKQLDAYRLKHQITVPQSSPKPVFTFDELNLPKSLLEEIKQLNFADCTPIQAQGFPILLSGTNVAGSAVPGSGKALACVVSAVVHVFNQPQEKPSDGPIALILAPNNDLVEEIHRIASQFTSKCNMKCSYHYDIEKRSKKIPICDLLISTADAIYDSLDAAAISLHRCSYFALYEFDRIIETGSEDEVHRTLSQLRPDCQRVIWTTTWNGEIRDFSMDVLGEHTVLNVGTTSPKLNANPNVKQTIKICTEQTKREELQMIIDSIEESQQNRRKTLIFVESKQRAIAITQEMRRKRYECKSLHTGLSQMQRETILLEFQNDCFPYLVLTDAVARNVNFSGIDYIVNYDFPLCVADYLLRIDQTGRSDTTVNESFALFSEENGFLADDLIEILKEANQPVDPALYILKAANVDSDDEISFAVPKGKGFKKYQIDGKSK